MAAAVGIGRIGLDLFVEKSCEGGPFVVQVDLNLILVDTSGERNISRAAPVECELELGRIRRALPSDDIAGFADGDTQVHGPCVEGSDLEFIDCVENLLVEDTGGLLVVWCWEEAVAGFDPTSRKLCRSHVDDWWC